VNRLAAAAKERKVRATQGIPLPNRKRSVRVSWCRRKEPPKPERSEELLQRKGKGEKVGQEPTRSAAMSMLCTPGVESSCKPAHTKRGRPVRAGG